MLNSKRGGFTCFLALVITGVIVLMTVLLKASTIRYEETLITGILIQQQDLVLSNYSEKLLDWYGIYATSMQDTQAESFWMTVNGIEQIGSYQCEGTDRLDEEDHLRRAILEFSRPRVPMQLLIQSFSRFTEINSYISADKYSDPASETQPSQSSDPSSVHSSVSVSNDTIELPDPADDFPGAKPVSIAGYQDIIELLGGIDQDTFNESIPDGSSVDFEWDNLEQILRNGHTDPVYETIPSKKIKSTLTVTESNLNEIASYLDQFCQIGNNPFYDKLCFEYYISSMFSCKSNVRIQDGIKVDRKDLRSRSIVSLPVRNALEIEKIIFGYEKDETNDFFTKTSIETIRFLIHLISNLSDEKKKAEISGAAVILCGAVALLSGGMVAVPQDAMEVVVTILMSMSDAVRDYKTLTEGKGVPLLPDEGWKKVDTYYTDYLQLFLLMVPEQVKIDRMLHIIRTNLDLSSVPLYTGIVVRAEYRTNCYEVEGSYEG